MKSNRMKSTSIPKEVKKIVYERDGHCCVFCGVPVEPYFANAHVVPRSRGGLGIVENIVTLCPNCHHDMDHSVKRGVMLATVRVYLRYLYPNYDTTPLVFEKGKKNGND